MELACNTDNPHDTYGELRCLIGRAEQQSVCDNRIQGCHFESSGMTR